MNLDHVKVIVFDLDGTLYEDTHHFSYYADRLAEKLSPASAERFMQDYQAALADEHPLKIGRIYDVKKDFILVQVDGVVKEAYHWDGSPLAETEVESIYPEPITVDLENMLSVGDLWWVPGSIARHYDLDGKQAYEAFIATREYMMSPQFEMRRVPGFKEALQQVRQQAKLVLLTNSPRPDSETILRKLELAEVFELKIFEGKKPVLTPQRFAEIQDHFGVEYSSILSIGDNWLNEILPAKRLGCSTIFIDPHHIGGEAYADVVVERIADVIPYLMKVGQEKN